MDKLNKVISYWLECLKHEDILNQEIPITDKSKAIIYPNEKDDFIFSTGINKSSIIDEKTLGFLRNCFNRSEDVFYGYPILLYYNAKLSKRMIAPLFIIKLNFNDIDSGLGIELYREDSNPNIGATAFKELGLQIEEISTLNSEFQQIFISNLTGSLETVNSCMELISKATRLAIAEEINPNSLTNHRLLTGNERNGLYNKSILFAGETTNYNLNLINDLISLKTKNDIIHTSLSFLTNFGTHEKKEKSNEFIPILPYPMNEYQIDAIRESLNNKLTVITGPPGTGKSQFIMNLLINLFLNDKKVLFVSHTNEAVDVVNEKINNDFKNLIFRTGNKEFRQKLFGQLNELLLNLQKNQQESNIKKRIKILWNKINNLKKDMLLVNDISNKVNDIVELSFIKNNYFDKLKLGFYRRKLKNKPTKLELEKEIKNLENDIFSLSRDFFKGMYINKMLENQESVSTAKSFLKEIEKINANAQISDHFYLKALNVIKIWSSTLKSLNRSFPLKAGIFDYVIFDESSQVDLPSAAPALYRAKSAIIVGDPMQLSHISGIKYDVEKEIAQSFDLDKDIDLYPHRIRYCDISLYKSAEASLNKVPILLAKHYRSDDQIIDLCNRVFYGGQLKISSNLNLSIWPKELPLGVEWIDCKGINETSINGGRFNDREINLTLKTLEKLINHINNTDLTIGIVTPYSEQQKKIANLIEIKISKEIIKKHDIKVLTAHKFQGSERDIMIFSVVISSNGQSQNSNWFNNNPQIINVALSRAKFLLCIIGDKSFCEQNNGILKKISDNYDMIKHEQQHENAMFSGKFDSKAEEHLHKNLIKIDYHLKGFELIPKYVEKRYTLDFALISKDKKIDIECDGFSNHNMINGLPVIEDIERDEYLSKRSWQILRFANYDIFSNTNKVLDKILKEVSN